jgi:hypothetical protein
MSQLGMMVIAVGLSSYNVALFHLVNHAYELRQNFNLLVINFISRSFLALGKSDNTNVLCNNLTAETIETQGCLADEKDKDIPITKEVFNNKKLNPYFVTGFADGESSFVIKIFKSKTHNVGWQVYPVFLIELHIKDIDLLEKIHSFFGVGSVRITKTRNSVVYSVTPIKDLKKIINHFDMYPLLTKKKLIFCYLNVF